MKPYISILIATTRVGGLDVLFTTLESQTFKDFELILMDSLYYHRKELVIKQAAKYSFPVKHLIQLETATDLCKSYNNGLIHAQGKLIYLMPDFTWLDVNCLQKHVDFHKNKSPNDNIALMGHFWDCALPALHKDFYRKYASESVFYREDAERKFEKEERQKFNNYMEDINSGKLSNLMWSIFENPITLSNLPTSFQVSVPKEIHPAGIVDKPQGKFVFKNESYLAETLLDINGFDEALDGSHGWQDTHIITELATTTNTKFYSEPEALAFTLNPRDILYARYRRRPVFSNEKVWQDGIETKYKSKYVSCSLKESKEYASNPNQTIIKPVKNKPYISIVTPMMRPGGLDVLFNSLERSLFKDFELIIVDSLYHYRQDLIKEKAKKYSFKHKHIPTIIDKFPVQSYSHAMNTGITNVSGDVILFTSDFRHFTPEALQKHADFHRSHDDNFGYAPPSKFMLPPPLKSGLPCYGFNENYNQYVEDLKSGKLQQYMWSIFENDLFDTPQDPSSWEEIDKLKVGYDSKTDYPFGAEVSPLYIYLQSESIKTKMVLQANGLNEALDGGHSYPDIEFSHRLRNLFNFKWIGDNTNPTYKITGGHNIINKMKLLDDVERSSKAIFDKYNEGSVEPVNTWNLSKIHNANQLDI